jgi:hypothetical protein
MLKTSSWFHGDLDCQLNHHTCCLDALQINLTQITVDTGNVLGCSHVPGTSTKSLHRHFEILKKYIKCPCEYFLSVLHLCEGLIYELLAV